jgi:YHS domain-containing protein
MALGSPSHKGFTFVKEGFHIEDGSWENGMAIDPVCKMTVDEKTTKLRSAHDGRVFYFCSEACKASFDKDPHRFGHSM